MRLESLEDRVVLTAGPMLTSLVPNGTDPLLNGQTLTFSPTDFLFQFDEGQVLDVTTINNSILITGSGADDTFDTADDVAIAPDAVTLGDMSNQIDVELAAGLADDFYRIVILGAGTNALANMEGYPFNDGLDQTIEFEVNVATGPTLVSINPNNDDILDPGETLDIAPSELRFQFGDGQIIDVDSLASGITITRSGADGALGTADDVVITPGFLGIGSQLNEIVFRIAESLPDDTYRIDVTGTGTSPLMDTAGFPFNDGEDFSINFELNLAPQVIAVVPQPIQRDAATGALEQMRNQIVVYFNNDDLDLTSAQNPNFYQLLATQGTITNTDDGDAIKPTSVVYDATANSATLTFASELHLLSSGPGAYRLRIGTSETQPDPPVRVTVADDPGSSFDAASIEVGTLTAQGQILSAAIDPQPFILDLPGSNNDIGSRNVNLTTTLTNDTVFLDNMHLADDSADSTPGTTELFYNFRDIYGADDLGNPLTNVITERQKERAREVIEIYSKYLGLHFTETADQGFTIVTGVLDAIEPNVVTGFGGITALAAQVSDFEVLVDGVLTPIEGRPTAIMDAGEIWEDSFGENWFQEAMRQVGYLLGMGGSFDLPDGTIMGSDSRLTFGTAAEPVFPGDHDILHGQHLFRPDSNDIDLYQFTVADTGLFTAETFAERLADSSQLDTVLRLYRQDIDGRRTLIAQNDDYFSEDSLIRLSLAEGTYYLGVSASGNAEYDPTIAGTGFGGTSQGDYELRLQLRSDIDVSIRDATGIILDGDADGIEGGIHNYWFRVASPDDTLLVDKLANSGGDGSELAPFNNIPAALAATDDGDIVRIVGNNSENADLTARQAYQIGFDVLGNELSDGDDLIVPRGVTVMVDEGAVFKMRRSVVQVGTSDPTVDHSGANFQVVGTPDHPVIFTSANDETIGDDSLPAVNTNADEGDWGGIIFQNDLDLAISPDRVDETNGIFLNHVNHADMRFGGGLVLRDSIQEVINPIHMIDARPTVSHNIVTNSADAAFSANPDSFLETNFHSLEFQTIEFTSDYDRVGPEINNNRLLDNSINGFFVRVNTPAGGSLEALTVAGRFDDLDVVHVIKDTVTLAGTPGGSQILPGDAMRTARTDASLVIDPGTVVKLEAGAIEAEIGTQLLAEGTAEQRVVFTSLLDSRFGAGGTFVTGGGVDAIATEGDWAGLVIRQVASANFDHAVFAYGGGIRTLEGSFAESNVIEVIQSDVRIAHSVLERNADGVGGLAPIDRFGRGFNVPATIFVRGAQPVILDNDFQSNAGPVISINANSLNHYIKVDPGRQTGLVDIVSAVADNQGPLIRLNRIGVNVINLDDARMAEDVANIGSNEINGMVIRGGTLTTQSVWDDIDIVHVLRDTIYVPDLHTFGGLRLASSSEGSLVVKLDNLDPTGQDPSMPDTAGFVATGRPLGIDDRVGGRVELLGQPGHPVILTSLADDSVGAGLGVDGRFIFDTDGNGAGDTGPLNLPTGPEVDNDVLIDNDVAVGIPGQFAVHVLDGGGSTGGRGGISARGNTQDFSDVNVIFEYLNLVDVGSDGEGINLADTTITIPATLMEPDLVVSEGEFEGDNGTIRWRVESTFLDGDTTFFNTVTFSSDGALGDLQFINHLDEDIRAFTDDILFPSGTPGEADFRVFTLDGPQRIGFSQGGVYEEGDDLKNATYDGWAADEFRDLLGAIEGAGTQYTIDGNIDVVDLEPFVDPRLGDAFGPEDVTTAFAWTVDPAASTATITTFLELVPRDPISGAKPGDWQGVSLEQYSQDRNVQGIIERESTTATAFDPNGSPSTAQVIGQLAPNQKAGDDNLRLGFEIHGFINNRADTDVYSFRGVAGTEIWLDIDRTSSVLDSVVELINSDGVVLARSDNSAIEGPSGSIGPQGFAEFDHYTTNPFDAGMRLTLPGPVGSTNTYYVRVSSESGLTEGQYELQIRIQETDEFPGSSISFADIRFATIGVEIVGLPTHSPLIGESTEDSSYNDFLAEEGLEPAGESTVGHSRLPVHQAPQHLGNLLNTDRAAISIFGHLENARDVDWYRFHVAYDAVQGLPGITESRDAGVVFDIDYADGIARPDSVLSVYNNNGELIYYSETSDVVLDHPNASVSDKENLAAGSFGARDPFIGPVELASGPETGTVARFDNYVIPGTAEDPGQAIFFFPEGTYFVAVSTIARIPEDIARGESRTDVIPTLTGRGQNVTGGTGSTTFVANPNAPENAVTDGEYQLEIRYTPIPEGGFDASNATVADENRRREQGQVIVSATSITNASGFGIVVDDGLRDLPNYGGGGVGSFQRQPHAQATSGDYLPHGGGNRSLVELNKERIVPGLTIKNNLIANNIEGGIHFQGDPNGFVLRTYNLDTLDEVADTGFGASLNGLNFTIRDINGLEQQFVFDESDENDIVIEVDTDPASAPATSAGEVATAIIQAIQSSELDVTIYRGEFDSFFIEGAAAVGNNGSCSSAFVICGQSFPAITRHIAQQGPVPFGRILNNTLVGRSGSLIDNAVSADDVGILVEDNASPTLLNNVIVNFTTGIQSDPSSTDVQTDRRTFISEGSFSTLVFKAPHSDDLDNDPTKYVGLRPTVTGGNLYQANLSSATLLGLGDFAISLSNDDSLFVDAENGNFFLAAGSLAIDSSVDSVRERDSLERVTDVVGISPSPILAPQTDLLGNPRVNDSDVDSPGGSGLSPIKDRGAIDRADRVGPIALLITPTDVVNPDGVEEGSGDQDGSATLVMLLGENLREFAIQITDGLSTVDPGFTGADDLLVTKDQVVVIRDDRELVEGIDYIFTYDSTNDVIRLASLRGIWPTDSTYKITLNNATEDGIKDQAGNPLQSNQPNDTVQFTVQLGEGRDFGDAPDPTYPTLSSSDGASHQVEIGFFLGSGVDTEVDAAVDANAAGDAFDDGVTFPTLFRGSTQTITVEVSLGGRSVAFVDAFIDFNLDGDWDDDGEKVLDRVAVAEGTNSLSTGGIPFSAVLGETFARVRLSSVGGLAATGESIDGEVEDYRVTVSISPWQNPADPFDVNGSQSASPQDALFIINELDEFHFADPETGLLPLPVTAEIMADPRFGFLDVNGDGFVSPLDALFVINAIDDMSSTPVAASSSMVVSSHVVAPQRHAGAVVRPVSSAAVDVAIAQLNTNESAVGQLNGSRPASTTPTRSLTSLLATSSTNKPARSADSLDDVLDEIAADIGRTWQSEK